MIRSTSPVKFKFMFLVSIGFQSIHESTQIQFQANPIRFPNRVLAAAGFGVGYNFRSKKFDTFAKKLILKIKIRGILDMKRHLRLR